MTTSITDAVKLGDKVRFKNAKTGTYLAVGSTIDQITYVNAAAAGTDAGAMTWELLPVPNYGKAGDPINHGLGFFIKNVKTGKYLAHLSQTTVPLLLYLDDNAANPNIIWSSCSITEKPTATHVNGGGVITDPTAMGDQYFTSITDATYQYMMAFVQDTIGCLVSAYDSIATTPAVAGMAGWWHIEKASSTSGGTGDTGNMGHGKGPAKGGNGGNGQPSTCQQTKLWSGTLDATSEQGVSPTNPSITLKAGDVISVTATGTASLGKGYNMTGPEGIPVKDPSKYPNLLDKNANNGAVLIQIGKDMIPVGKEVANGTNLTNYTVKNGGLVTFLYNDQKNDFKDNQGQFTITLYKDTCSTSDSGNGQPSTGSTGNMGHGKGPAKGGNGQPSTSKTHTWSGKLEATNADGLPTTGLTVKKGWLISVTATGQVTIDKNATPIYGYVDANGVPGDLESTMVAPNVNASALLMKIGTGAWFLAGTSLKDHPAENDGEIVFIVNDRVGTFADNAGEFVINVTVVEKP